MERAELDQWKAKEVARLLALVETERRYYQDVIATLPVGLLVVSADFRVISANRAFRRTFKLRTEDVLHRDLREVLPLPQLQEHIAEVIASGSTRLHILYEPGTTPGGQYLRISIASLRNWEEEAEREAVLLVEDLTGIRTAMLPVGEPAAARPLEPAPAMHWEADAGTLTPHPRGEDFKTLLGHVPENWWKAVAADDVEWVQDFFRRAFAQREACQCEHRMVNAGGGLVWVRSVVCPRMEASGAVTGLTGLTLDIGQVRARERELLDTHVLDAMARWSGRLTHDFNNLLMIITGYGQEILDSLPPRDARRADLEEILRGSQKVSGMIRELMTLSRPPIAQPRRLDLGEALAAMESQLREAVAGRAEVRIAVDPGTGLVDIDPAHLESMVVSLVRQASQMAGPGVPVVLETGSVEIGSRYARPDAPLRQCVRLTARAAGLKLDAETRARLFEPLLAVKEPELAPGLFPICGIVRQAGGELHVDEEPDGDTVLALYLPWAASPRTPVALPEGLLETAAPPPVEPRAQTAAIEPEPLPAETVLVVEDDPGIRALMRKILTRQSFAVLEAAGGEEALRLAENHSGPIRLLITDLLMPHMSGREVSERLRASRPDVKVIFVSGYTDDPMIQAGELPEGTAFLQKPFTLGALLDKVHAILGSSVAAG